MAMWHIARRVIEESDIILEVLDARFIQETRNKKFEEMITSQGKKLIYIVNKIDLVRNTYLREHTRDLNPNVLVSTVKHLGTQKVRDMIKQHAREKGTTSVGVIGYPNTGKSSLINALIGKGSTRTGQKSGTTRGTQYLRLTSFIKLIDSPGTYSIDKDSLILMSAKDISKESGPEYYADMLLEHFPDLLKTHYHVATLEELAEKRGHIKKGGVPDLARTARTVLQDWQQGKIII